MHPYNFGFAVLERLYVGMRRSETYALQNAATVALELSTIVSYRA